MAITLPLRSQTGLTLSLEPTESSGGWTIYESFEQVPPATPGSVTGQTSGTEVFTAIGNFSRSTSNVVDGTYSWQSAITEFVANSFGWYLYIAGTGDTFIDISAYAQARVTFTVSGFSSVSPTLSRLVLRVDDNTSASIEVSSTVLSDGTYQLTLPLTGAVDLTQAYWIMYYEGIETNPSDNITGTIYIDAFEVNTEAAALVNGFKVWNGSAWVVKPVKMWNGLTWVEKPLKRWNGSSWVAVEY